MIESLLDGVLGRLEVRPLVTEQQSLVSLRSSTLPKAGQGTNRECRSHARDVDHPVSTAHTTGSRAVGVEVLLVELYVSRIRWIDREYGEESLMDARIHEQIDVWIVTRTFPDRGAGSHGVDTGDNGPSLEGLATVVHTSDRLHVHASFFTSTFADDLCLEAAEIVRSKCERHRQVVGAYVVAVVDCESRHAHTTEHERDLAPDGTGAEKRDGATILGIKQLILVRVIESAHSVLSGVDTGGHSSILVSAPSGA